MFPLWSLDVLWYQNGDRCHSIEILYFDFQNTSDRVSYQSCLRKMIEIYKSMNDVKRVNKEK